MDQNRNEVENTIEVSHVKKKFRVYMDKGYTMKELALFSFRRRFEERVVLNDISFNVRKGEAVGLIGHNGCGKSTTLKLLTRIMYPDEGSITMRGRVSSLIELGAGFHPDMSGRENIYINASIFGLTRKEIDSRLEDIIEFSELQDYIDNPVRTYSSGMYMRLAFSVAINVDADILLIDEILAVGDANFQTKCFNKMQEIKAAGTTIVLVSHSMEQIERLCDRAIRINDGKIVLDGNPKDVDMAYLEFMNNERKARAESEDEKKKDPAERKRYGNQKAMFEKIRLLGKDGKEGKVFETGSPFTIRAQYKVSKKVEDAVFGIGIFRNDGLWVYGTNTRIAQKERFDLVKDGEFLFRIDSLDLIQGAYWLDVTIEWGNGNPVDYYKQAVKFEVVSKYKDVGVACFGHDWTYAV